MSIDMAQLEQHGPALTGHCYRMGFPFDADDAVQVLLGCRAQQTERLVAYGSDGITVAVRIGYDDSRCLGDKEMGGPAALPVFREIVEQAYAKRLLGPVPRFPAEIERDIDGYLEASLPAKETPPATGEPQPAAAPIVVGSATTTGAGAELIAVGTAVADTQGQ